MAKKEKRKIKNYCAYVGCNNQIELTETFCRKCRVNKSVIGLSDQNREAAKRGHKDYVVFMLLMNGMNFIPDWANKKGFVPAAISNGRWYAKCPDEECKNNIPLDEYQDCAFCTVCLNVANDFKPYTVRWENVDDLKLIMAARVDKRRRNFVPHAGETRQDLLKENEKYGWRLE